MAKKTEEAQTKTLELDADEMTGLRNIVGQILLQNSIGRWHLPPNEWNAVVKLREFSRG